MSRSLSLLLVLVLFAVSCGDDASSSSEPAGSSASDDATTTSVAAESTTTTTSTPAAPLELLGDGEFEVGVTTITITDEARDRPLTVDVWFPLDADVDGEPHRYTFVTGDYYDSPRAFTVEPAVGSAAGPFPLVVYSHGSGGLRFIHSDYTETLASHGHVVVAPDHTGNTAVERITESSDPSEVIARNRPLDVSAVLDGLFDPTNDDTAPLREVIDAERIALTGHSFGGFTAYAAVAGFENSEGTVAPDPRIDAIIPIAPAVGPGGDESLLGDEDLARVGVPSLVIVGTDDKTTPVDPNVTRAWEHTSSDPHYRLELAAAEHQSFTDLCNYLDSFDQLEDPTPIVVETVEELAEEGCSEGDMPIERVQELTNTFAVTFLDSVFADGEMILPDAVELPDDVDYQAK